MILPFKPEPIESLRSRFPKAIEETVDVESVLLGSAMNPTLLRKHVFDFEDHYRLCVSRDVKTNGNVVVHVSGGCLIKPIHLWSTQESVLDSISHYCSIKNGDYDEEDRILILVGIDPAGVPHLEEL